MNSCKRGAGLSPAGLDLDGDEIAVTSKPLDFSRLNKLMAYSSGEGALSLFQTFSVFTKRHGAEYCAALIKHEELMGETQETFAEDWGYEHLLRQRPWYPYRLGRSAEEAMGALLTFLNDELTHDREELITWAGNCGVLEYYLSKGQDCCYQGFKGTMPEDWVVTYDEAIGRKN